MQIMNWRQLKISTGRPGVQYACIISSAGNYIISGKIVSTDDIICHFPLFCRLGKHLRPVAYAGFAFGKAYADSGIGRAQDIGPVTR